MAKCIWESTNTLGKTCDREATVGSDYCLYHKPNKTPEESWLFWKVINYNPFKLFTSEERLLYKTPWKWENYYDIESHFNNKINDSIIANFSQDEIDRNLNMEKLSIIKKEILNSRIHSDLLIQNSCTIDFNGFIFPDLNTDINFNYQNGYITNDNCVLDFSESIFECPAIFINLTFDCICKFDYVSFEKQVLFASCNFKKSAYFKDVFFSNTGYLGKSIFEEIFVYGNEFVFENIGGNKRIDFSQIRFSNNTNFVLKDINFPKSYGEASYGENAYRIAKNQSNSYGDYENASEYRYLEQCYKGYQIFPPVYIWNKDKQGFRKFEFIEYLLNDKPLSKILPKIWDLIIKYSIGYGEKPYNALISTFFILLFFTYCYLFAGVEITT